MKLETMFQVTSFKLYETILASACVLDFYK